MQKLTHPSKDKAMTKDPPPPPWSNLHKLRLTDLLLNPHLMSPTISCRLLCALAHDDTYSDHCSHAQR